VIDLYSIKPIDKAALQSAGKATNGRLLVVEDHYAEGGIGSAVKDALVDERGVTGWKILHLCVRDLPRSGTPRELLAAAQIDAHHIEVGARSLVGESD
jgi:transketolase